MTNQSSTFNSGVNALFLFIVIVMMTVGFLLGQAYERNQPTQDCLWQCFRTETGRHCPICGWVCED